jgi:hypothetical protein
MAMLALGNAVLLGGVRTRNSVRNTGTLEITTQLVIFTAPVRLDGFNLGVQKTLYMSLKRIKNLFNIRFVFKKIDPNKTRVVIDKANIVLITAGRSTSGAPNIRMNQFKRHSGNTRGSTIR